MEPAPFVTRVPQPDGRDAALDRPRGPQVPPVLGWVAAEGGQRLPVAAELGERLGVLEALLLAGDLDRAACFSAGGSLDDLAEEPLRAWLKALEEGVDHVPGGV